MLSASGLFQSVKGHVMTPALIPYSVNAVLWSDGAAKERWLHLPEGGKIDFTTWRGWNFPDLTTIVKVVRINSRTIRAHQPATIGSGTELRDVSANARSQRVLTNV